MVVLEQRFERAQTEDFIQDFARQPFALGKAEGYDLAVDGIANDDQHFVAGRVADGLPQFFQIEAVENLAMQVGFYLLVVGALERLQICHWALSSYTDLNNDHAARFTSASFCVNSCASPAKHRAISVLRCSITGVPRSIAPDIAKYWLGIRHSSFAPTAVSASVSLNPGTLRKRFNT